MQTKYIVVTGGVISGLGKGIAAASIGHLLSYNYKVVPIKCDGYLNVDPGTMNPVEHGEVFVLDDGTEVDMDFGHYERFLNTACTGRQNLTMGKVFRELYLKERKGDFLGQTVQLIPHAANHILNWWQDIAYKRKADVVLIEIGGTVGDIENELYLEAARRLRFDVGADNVLFAHLTYVPRPTGVNEQKSKPTQQSSRMLMKRGITPDLLLCRSSKPITEKIRMKIALFSNVPANAVLDATDVDDVYKIPLLLEKQGIIDIINKKFGLFAKPELNKWQSLLQKDPNKTVNIAICGKYTSLEDSYASVVESLKHAGANNNTHVSITWIDTQTNDLKQKLKDVDGIIVPGGFGSRGIEGKINIIKHCRENNIPFLGICYGLQLAVIEFARSVCNLEDAHTTEVNPNTKHPLVDILPDKENLENMGGTLRLGSYDAYLTDGKIKRLYGKEIVSERHRHRYEVNPKYHELLQEHGLKLSGLSKDKRLVEFIELEDHPYFVATQAHPELKSTLLKPAPLFDGLVKACIQK